MFNYNGPIGYVMKIITGMHRSGTSLVARLFFEAGADMGDPDSFYRPDKWNPDGYFEQPDIHSINMPLVNGPFWKFSYFWLPSEESIMKRAARKSKLIHETALLYNDKIIKETRFCLTLPAWQKYGEKIDKIIVCLRDPEQVAQSLKRRNKITLSRAYSLWIEHNQRLLENTENMPLWFLYYGDLVHQNRFKKEMIPAFQFFEIEVQEEKLGKLASLIVTPKPISGKIEPDYPEPVRRLWDTLLALHTKQFKSL